MISTTVMSFTIRLVSDGAPATGLGSDFLDGMLPRDHLNRFAIPASHIKGVMRSGLHEILMAAR